MQPNNRITYRFDRNGNKMENTTTLDDSRTLHDTDYKMQKPVSSSLTENQILSAETDSEELYGLDIESLEQLIRGSNYKDEFYDQEQEDKPALLSVDKRATNIYNDSLNGHIDDAKTDHYIANEEELTWELTFPYEQKTEMVRGLRSVNRTNNQSLPEVNEELHQAVNQMAYDGSPIIADMDEQDIRLMDTIATQKSSFTWGNGLVTVLCAVATGMLLGYLLLVQVFGSMFWQPSAQTQAPISTDSESTIPVVPSSNDEATTGAIHTSEAHFSYQLLQAGVFSQENTRDEAIAALQSAGYAASYTKSSNDRYYVYTAAATSAINAEPFKNAVSGFELYRKELALQIPASMQFNGKVELLEEYFNSSNALLATYADLVAAQLEQPSLSKIGSSAQEAVERKYELWKQISKEATAGFKDTKSESYALEINVALANAQANMIAYQAKPSKKTIWSVEEEIVKTIIIQKEWFEQLS